MNMMITADMRVAKGIAMALAPFDTGNLRFNAIKSMRTSKGFRIKYSLSDAYYIYFLEEGTRYSNKHKGKIGNVVVPTIASYLYSKYESLDKKKENRFKYVGRMAQTDNDISDKREYKNEQSLKLDVDKMAIENKWEHDTSNEVYDRRFMDRSI